MNFTEKYNYALRHIQPPGCGNGTHGGHDKPGIMGKIIRTVTECITSFQNGGKIIINPMTGKEGLIGAIRPPRLSCLPGHYREEKGQYQRLLWLSAEGRHIS